MKALEALKATADLCASQKGMLTTAQARTLGVDRMTLSRLARNGQLEQVSHGVYRAASAPSSREEDVYASWLALDPASPAFDRPCDGSGFTASLNTAAWLQDLGELKPSPMVFSSPERRQSRTGLRFLKRTLHDADITVVAGIPVTTAKRTVLDLLDHGEDLSLVASVLRDAEAAGMKEDIEQEVNARAMRCGFAEGFDLYGYLKGREG